METNKVKTAVDWLMSQKIENFKSLRSLTSMLEEAKKIETKQLKETYEWGAYSIIEVGHGETFEEYYGKKFEE
jgi:hypothetical protein